MSGINSDCLSSKIEASRQPRIGLRVTECPLKLVPLMTFRNALAQIQTIADTPFGHRVTYIAGEGTFEGPRLKGKILPGGGDWLLKGKDGLSFLDVRKTFETHDEALIHVSYTGLYRFSAPLTEKLKTGVPSEFGETLFQTQVRFETGDARYDWLNETLAVGEGKEMRDSVEYRLSALVS